MLYDPLIGELIEGRYKIETRLGEGALSTVYAATHTLIEKRVALKVLKSEFVKDAEIVERFLREAKAASRLSHVNIVSISDFGKVPSGAPFFAMELIDGRTLDDLLYGDRPLSIGRAVSLITEIGRGLAVAHQHGVVHRDLKPENIGLARDDDGNEHVKILDFGLAKITQENRKLTRAGQVLGTPKYMSPEQASGGSVDHRSDIFALGILLYQLTTGRVPFAGESFMAVISCLLSEEPDPPRTICDDPELTPAIEQVILRALARQPEDRFPTMDAMLEALRLATRPVDPEPAPQTLEYEDPTVASTLVDTGEATGQALAEGPTRAKDSVSESDGEPATSASPLSPEVVQAAAARVEETLGDLWIEEHTAKRVIRRAARARARRRKIVIFGFIGAIGISAGILVAVWLTSNTRTRKRSGGNAGSPGPSSVMRPPSAESGKPATSAMRAAPGQRSAPARPKSIRRKVKLAFGSVPSGATVYLDKKPAGRTPLVIGLEAGTREVVAVIAKKGYRAVYRTFRPDRDVTINVRLVRAPTRPSGMMRGTVVMRPRASDGLRDLKDPFAMMGP